MSFYSSMQKTSNRLASKFGMSVILRQYPTGAAVYDESSLSVVMPNPVDYTRKAILADQPGSQIARRFGQSLDTQSDVQKVEKWIYLDNKGPAPRLQDKIILQDVEYTIINSQVIAPGGVALMYLLVLKA